MIKKNDIILLVIILMLGIGTFLFMKFIKEDGDKVIIKVDGQVYKELPLDEDTTFKIEGPGSSYNTLLIQDGYVDMIDASCPDKLCVEQHKIHKSGESIICLPNRVVIEMDSKVESDLDGIAN